MFPVCWRLVWFHESIPKTCVRLLAPVGSVVEIPWSQFPWSKTTDTGASWAFAPWWILREKSGVKMSSTMSNMPWRIGFLRTDSPFRCLNQGICRGFEYPNLKFAKWIHNCLNSWTCMCPRWSLSVSACMSPRWSLSVSNWVADSILGSYKKHRSMSTWSSWQGVCNIHFQASIGHFSKPLSWQDYPADPKAMKIVTKILEKNPEVTSFECYAIAREAGELVQVGEVTAD